MRDLINAIIFCLFLFSIPIPIIPVIIWHIGKGICEEVGAWLFR